ncbi:hypothetical protein AMK27_39240 [Streptomyces sp. CB02009]|nr:hypothetical protein AMK27_39240 [Streptomyces sp. CB02009]
MSTSSLSSGPPTSSAYGQSSSSENSDRIDAPSEDALFMQISELNNSDNTYVVVQPDEDDPVWFASVAVLDEGGYEVVRRDTARDEHEVTTATSTNDIARDLTSWIAARDFPGRPTRQVSEF